MTTIPQNQELLKHLFEIIQNHREIFTQERVYQRVVALLLAEIFVFARHTVTQLIMSLGMTEQDWSGWYRLFSHKRFNYDSASKVLFQETLKHVEGNEVYVVGGDAEQILHDYMVQYDMRDRVVEIYSEKHPCPDCMDLLQGAGYRDDLPVYWSFERGSPAGNSLSNALTKLFRRGTTGLIE